MLILSTPGWEEYSLLDSGNSLRLEKFDPYTIVRPDPQAIWQPSLSKEMWDKADAIFERTSGGYNTAPSVGKWKFNKKLPDKWLMHWKNVSFWVHLTSFKHTGVFPEQSLQWEWIQERVKGEALSVKDDKNNLLSPSPFTLPPNILNLFGYTGIATLATASVGAKVTHVDASKPSINWARENAEVSGLAEKPIRWILDDAEKFVEKEIRRGNTYDGIIMDPPVYGHGPTGQIWKFNENFPKLMVNIKKLLSSNPLFIIVNAYAISSSALMLQNVMEDNLKQLGGRIEVGELVLEEKESKRPLSTGIYGRWFR